MFFAVSPAYSDDFEYDSVFTCGPKNIASSYKYEGPLRHTYFYVHTAKNGNFVILHDDVQFTNFRDTILSHLFFQNGGIFRASLKVVDGVSMYRFMNKKDSGWVQTFNVDMQSMTYVSRITLNGMNFAPSIGVCWNEEIK